MDKKESKLSLNKCLIGCQSIECAPKTCCSTSDLDTIITDDAARKLPKFIKSKNPNKSNSLMSLNVTSLTKFRKMVESTPDMIKKSVSESHVAQFDGESEPSKCVTPNISQAQSSDNFQNSYVVDALQTINTTTTDVPAKKLNANHVNNTEEQNFLTTIKPKLLDILVDRTSEYQTTEETSSRKEQEDQYK